MPCADPKAETDLILAALARAGRRGILVTGWGGMEAGKLTDSAIAVTDVPHAWLFPRVVAVVHHGGAGTTAAGLRAGVPSVVVPFNIDQPFWGRQVARLGVGPPPVAHDRLTVDRLATAIDQAVTDTAMRARAAALAAGISGEDGVGATVAMFEAICKNRLPLAR